MAKQKATNEKVEEYKRLVVARETLKKQANVYRDLYTKEFGDLIYEIYQKKIACIFLRKKISRCVLLVNQGETVVKEEIENYIDDEMSAYEDELKRWTDYYNKCQLLICSSEEEVLSSKIIFRRIAKLIHPDILGELAGGEEFKELWEKSLAAYGQNDADELAALEVLVHDALERAKIDVASLDIQDVELKIKLINVNMENIINSEPYTYKWILDDVKLIEEKRKALKEELNSYQLYEEQLEETLNNYYEGGSAWKKSIS